MVDWLPFVTQYPLTEAAGRTNYLVGGMRSDIRGLALHITDGHSELQYIRGHFSHPAKGHPNWGVSAHFAISRNGDIAQYLPLTARANTIDSYQHDQHWYSVENVAVRGESLTPQQIASTARLFLWLVQNKNVPNTLANVATDRGLGYHSMFHIGHPSCPGQGVIRQRDQIIAAVAQALAGEVASIRRDLSGI
jgi:hypothetical protein